MDFFRDALTSAYRIETLFYLFWTLNPQDLSIPLQMGLAASVLLRPKNPRIKSASPSNLNHITLFVPGREQHGNAFFWLHFSSFIISQHVTSRIRTWWCHTTTTTAIVRLPVRLYDIRVLRHS